MHVKIPQYGVYGSRDLIKFRGGGISANISSEMVQDRDVITMED